jgi:lipopolysaccharide/colanic/teichoic acid biosynthesis glycosyltransferase
VAAAARAVELRVRRASRMVYLVGSEEQRRDLQRQARRHGDMRIVGFKRFGEADAGGRDPARLAERIAGARATTLVLSAGAMRDETICAAAALCNVQGRRVRTLSGFYEEQFKRIPLSELTTSWFLFDIAEIHRPRLYAASKRAFESLLAGLLLLTFTPLLALSAAAVALSGRGGVLYRQPRVGRDGEPFTIVKFRTMRPADGAPPAAWATSDGARITRVGGWLRRFRLDELPQLWNVLRGQLSLIGPRPEQVGIVRELESKIPFYAARHVVRPGLTGWAQVCSGYGGSLHGALEKLQLDLYYVKHQSLRLDLLILASTMRAVARRHDDVSDPQPAAAGA